jgi:hypothetical protein
LSHILMQVPLARMSPHVIVSYGPQPADWPEGFRTFKVMEAFIASACEFATVMLIHLMLSPTSYSFMLCSHWFSCVRFVI